MQTITLMHVAAALIYQGEVPADVTKALSAWMELERGAIGEEEWEAQINGSGLRARAQRTSGFAAADGSAIPQLTLLRAMLTVDGDEARALAREAIVDASALPDGACGEPDRVRRARAIRSVTRDWLAATATPWLGLRAELQKIRRSNAGDA